MSHHSEFETQELSDRLRLMTDKAKKAKGLLLKLMLRTNRENDKVKAFYSLK